MKNPIKTILLLLVAATTMMTACSEDDTAWDPYYDWKARNDAWFSLVADTARTAIAQAKKQYGNQWEDHCDWRMYKTLLRSGDIQGELGDTICVHILKRGSGTICPAYTDSVGVSFRGWLMETQYENALGELEKEMSVFTQTYFGSYDPATAAIQVMTVSGTVEGFSTALQYMVEGDDWLVYIPQKLAYAEKSSSVIPTYSTLLYRLQMIRVYNTSD